LNLLEQWGRAKAIQDVSFAEPRSIGAGDEAGRDRSIAQEALELQDSLRLACSELDAEPTCLLEEKLRIAQSMFHVKRESKTDLVQPLGRWSDRSAPRLDHDPALETLALAGAGCPRHL